MQIGMVGLGKMGANMAERLLAGGHEVVGHDRDQAALDRLREQGGTPAAGLEELVAALAPPRALSRSCSSGMTWSSTEGTRTTRTRSAGRRSSPAAASSTSTAGRAAACGG
jgi:hypothetical protein